MNATADRPRRAKSGNQPRTRGGARLLAAVVVAAAIAAALPHSGGAQAGEGSAAGESASPWRVGIGAGWSYYSLVSRSDEGTTLFALGSFTPSPHIRVEATVRRMGCFDCERFVMAEAGVHFRLPMGAWAPYLSGGGGVTSDPDFVGTRGHAFAGVGTAWEQEEGPWGVQFEVRGRQLDPGSRLVEVTLAWTLRVPRGGGAAAGGSTP